MTIKLRTGNTDEPVTSAADGRLYASLAGLGSYVTSIGNKCAASLDGANTLNVQSGCILQNGRFIDLEGITSWTIPSGIQAKKRSNICVVRTTKEADGSEHSDAVTLTGDATADGTPVDPTYNDGSLLDGDTVVDFPLYRVVTDGINAQEPVPLFNILIPAKDAWDSLSQKVDSLKPLIKTRDAEAPSIYTIQAGGTYNAHYSVPNVPGYVAVGALGYNTGNFSVMLVTLGCGNGVVDAVFKNWASSSVTFRPSVRVLYVRNGWWQWAS